MALFRKKNFVIKFATVNENGEINANEFKNILLKKLK